MVGETEGISWKILAGQSISMRVHGLWAQQDLSSHLCGSRPVVTAAPEYSNVGVWESGWHSIIHCQIVNLTNKVHEAPVCTSGILIMLD